MNRVHGAFVRNESSTPAVVSDSARMRLAPTVINVKAAKQIGLTIRAQVNVILSKQLFSSLAPRDTQK